jgi:hypothetical protein
VKVYREDEGDGMKRQPWGLYAIALAILVVGLVALGVPASALLFAAVALACPLMMLLMMRGMRGTHDTPGGRGQHQDSPGNDQEFTSGRR